MASTAVFSRASRIWYEVVRNFLRLATFPLVPTRAYGLEHFPPDGAALVLSNHQSHLDPPLIGMVIPRQIAMVARRTLFDNKLFGGLIRSLNAIPLDRDGLGVGGLKETLRQLKQGRPVLLFPEGTRSPDGALQPLKPGFAALATRGRIPIVPAAIAGAFEAMPRSARFPRRGRVAIVFGPPITPEMIAELDDRALVSLVETRIRECFERATELRRR